MGEGKSPNLVRALRELQKQQDSRREVVAAGVLSPALMMLRGWQSRRLAHTYRDLLASQQYGQAARFFLSEIYAAKDFSQRDHDFERLQALLARVLPAQMFQILTDAIELNRFSYALDNQLLAVLQRDLNVSETITADQYAQAYRICCNYSERAAQIELMAGILREVSAGTHLPGVGISLRVLEIPARRAGWDELYDFLRSGYQAFQPMKDRAYFADTIQRREMGILDRILEEHDDPFEATASEAQSWNS